MITKEKVVQDLKIIKGYLEWDSPMDYQISLDIAIHAVQQLDDYMLHINEDFPDSIIWRDYDNIPNCCKRCSNHPSNGGLGICNCTLPLLETHKTGVKPW